MMVLAIDPGAKPGFCLMDDSEVLHVTYDVEDANPTVIPGLDEVVVEDQHLSNYIYKNGKRTRVSKKSQLTLVRTAERLLMKFPAERSYRILPDDWRRILWPGASRLTKTVVLARLRTEYNTLVEHLPKTHQPDCLEAIGIAVAWSKLSQEQKEKYRVE